MFQVYAPNTNAEEPEQSYEDLQDHLELTPKKKKKKKRLFFHHRRLEYKSRKSTDTWSNRQFVLGVQNEVGKRLTEFCQENALAIENTFFQQPKGNSTHGHQ